MSIEAKHAYRFGFLKSERWQNIRLECLARDRARCVVCGFEDISNDAHHIRYPKNGWQFTKRSDLRTLCRLCHEAAHEIIEDAETNGVKLNWGQIKSVIKLSRKNRGDWPNKPIPLTRKDPSQTWWKCPPEVRKERQMFRASIAYMRDFGLGHTSELQHIERFQFRKAIRKVVDRFTRKGVMVN